MFKFNLKYFVAAIFLFIVEVLIALFVRDRFVRPYFGDYLVVMLVYCAVRSVIQATPSKVAIGVLLFAYLIEMLQYFRIVDLLGLEKNRIAKVVIGYGFDWSDILAYTLGVITIIIVERARSET